MKTKQHSRSVKLLFRVLDTLEGFEVIIAGYRSLKVFREMIELLKTNCRVRNIVLIDIDVSALSKVGEFENLLREKKGKKKGRLIFNVTGLEKHVKAGRVSTFLNHINLIRDRLSADFSHGFFFWIPEGLIKRFALDAPDFWAWRNTVLVFEDKEILGKLEGIPVMSYGLEDFKNFTLKEKQRQIEYLQGVLETLNKKPPAFNRDKRLAQVYSDLGSLYYLVGKYEQALDCIEECLGIREALGDQDGIAADYNVMGLILEATGDYDSALDYCSKSLKISRKIGNKIGEGNSLNYIGKIYYTRGEYDSAIKYSKESLEINRETGNKFGEGTALNNISAIYHVRGEYDSALKYLKESLEINRETGNIAVEGTILSNISGNYSARGDYDTALKYLQESLKISRKIGNKSGTIITLHNMASIALRKENFSKFLKYEKKAYRIALEIRDAQGLYNVGRDLGNFLCRTGKKEEGLVMLEKSYEIGKKAGFPGVKIIKTLLKKFGKSQ
ncbi:MAG: tetratricopeptide repeat protein [Candidatus Aminicenantes bacterium]|nr:tetratricopeptide repeat protein [Candidatus Aminicenantes bacterium]